MALGRSEQLEAAQHCQVSHSNALGPVSPKCGRDFTYETPILWPPDAKSRLIGKDPDAERDWGQEEKGTTENAL